MLIPPCGRVATAPRGAVSLGNIAIHAAVMASVVGTARRALKWGHGLRQASLAALMIATVAVLLLPTLPKCTHGRALMGL